MECYLAFKNGYYNSIEKRYKKRIFALLKKMAIKGRGV